MLRVYLFLFIAVIIRFQMSSEEKSSEEQTKKKEEHHTGFFSALFVLINTSLGDGLFGSALAYAKAGLIGGIAIQLVVLFVAYLTFYYLIYCSDILGVYSFGDVCL